MKKTISSLIDELSVTNIKIYYLQSKQQKKKLSSEEAEKLRGLKKYHTELSKALDLKSPIKRPISSLIDELTVTNIKIFNLVDKILANKHTREDARKAQALNGYRIKICNILNKEFKERENIRV